MEDAYAIVVLTLLQLCRGEISKPEWFSANLINDPGYTPKPITEIFTSDSTSKNPALFTQPTTTTTSTVPPTSMTSTTIFQNENLSSQQIQTQKNPTLLTGQIIPQQPQILPQVVEDTTNTDLPSFVIIFDPKRQVNQNIRPSLVTSPAQTVTPPSIMATETTIGTESTSTNLPTVQDTTPPFQTRNQQQVPNSVSPPFWPPGSMFVYPIQISNFDPITNTTVVSVTETITSTVPPQPARPVKPLITVRLKSPKGSITNIKINPTTTTRPTTRRRRPTRKSNNYEICLSSCNGTKEPICSSPVGVIPVDPDKLKGFASLCHMACHNSFRREQVYEKVVDGRCGRLRTRIRPVDKNKLNRDELNKAQYTILHNGPETVMEFSPLTR